jgi:C1q domain
MVGFREGNVMKKAILGAVSLFISGTALAAPIVAFDAYSALPPQSLNPGFSQVLMPSILLNTGNRYSNTTSRFTAPYAGVYQFNANVSIDTGGQDCSAFILSVFVNGNEYRRLSRTGGGHQFELSGSTLTRLNAADTVDIRIYHNCALPIVVEADGKAYFNGAIL